MLSLKQDFHFRPSVNDPFNRNGVEVVRPQETEAINAA